MVQDVESAAMRQGSALKPALVGCRVGNEKQLDKVHHMAASKTNEWGATALKPAGVLSDRLDASFYPILLHTLFVGLVPPFSDFFLAVLKFY